MRKVVRLFLLLFGLAALLFFWQPWSINSQVFFAVLGLLVIIMMMLSYFLWQEYLRRRQAEEGAQIYKDSFERSNVGISHADQQGQWMRVNPRFAEILGYSCEELIGKLHQDFTYHDDLGKDEELTGKVWAGELPSCTLQKRFIRKDGQIVWVFLSASLSTPVSDRPRYMIRSIKDITAWKQAEDALMESSVQLRLATEAAQLGIWDYDVKAKTIRGNSFLWRILGVPEPVGDRASSMRQQVHPADQSRIQELFKRAVETGTEYTCEYRFVKSDGLTIWLETTGSPISNDKAQVTRFIGVTRDITDRKLAQLDFQRSVDVSPAILWITEKEGQCTYLSQQWYSFTGMKLAESLGRGWLNAVHEEDRERAEQFFVAKIAGTHSVQMEYRLRTAKGDYRWVIDAGNPRFDAEGVYLGHAGSIFDIHDRKEAQARVEETAQRFEVLANSIPQMAWMADRSGSVYWYNERWFTYSGTTLDEMKGHGWKKIHHPDHIERVWKKFFHAIDRGEVWEDTFPLRSATGEWRWFLSRAIPVYNDAKEIVQWFGTNTDITELREFQNALVESEARFRDLANSMPQLVWTSDPTGKVDYYNERTTEYEGFHLERDESWNWQSSLHPDDLELTTRTWNEALVQQKLYSCEHRMLMADGSYRWHLSRAIPVFHSDGKVKKWYGTATNIHEYKLALVETAKAKEIAEDANKAKSRFLANMSHEIRSPMSSVLGYADLLLERGLSEVDRITYASSIQASGGHLLAIIDDILDLSAVESGEFKIDRHPFAVVDLIGETVNSMAVLAQRKGLDLQVDFTSPIPRVIESDPLRVRQILLNLLSNAIKFTDKGRILVRLSYDHQMLTIEVEDSGVGIETGKAHKLFKAFSQVDSSISRKFGGTGLGLHLSRRLAEALGGQLALKWSVPACGSCFVLTVFTGEPEAPFVKSFQDHQRIVTKASPHVVAAQGSYSVLLAEDSRDNQILIRIFLTKLGARVDVAANGEEAVQLATHGRYDLILMDMMMPIMDGLEATRRLRAMGYHKPIVALTAHALKEEVEKSIAAGCDLHLSKPIQIDVLRHTIEVLLDRRRAGDVGEASIH
jgi:PAS domain S-box-containing protein